jgi:hypothetical protein
VYVGPRWADDRSDRECLKKTSEISDIPLRFDIFAIEPLTDGRSDLILRLIVMVPAQHSLRPDPAEAADAAVWQLQTVPACP